MAPQVSVVIPVFNGLPYLADAVDSALTQRDVDLELVLCEGGSTDGSVEWIASQMPAGARIMRGPAGGGAAANWTAACAAARAPFVKLLCQDDVLYPGALRMQLEDLQRFPEAGMATGPRDIVGASGRVLVRGRGTEGLPTGLVDGRVALRSAVRRGTNPFGEPVSVLFRRDALLEVLPWNDTDPYVLDLELYGRLLLTSTLVVRRDAIGAFRVSTGSWSTRLIADQMAQFERWQERMADRLELSPADRRAARFNLRRQTLTRRLAYRWLSWRDDLSPPRS